LLRSTWLLVIYVSFLGLSANAPFVATLGYVWVDTFQPQAIAYFVLNQLPVAMIMAMAALGGYLLFDRRCPPHFNLQTALQIVMALWVTITLIWAQAPEAAWAKWDWAFKTIVFATFVPYVIRSKVQIEAFVQTYVFSLAANFVPFGIKVLYSGGGYGMNLGLQSGNSGLAEGGLLSTSCLMVVPLSIYLAGHGALIPKLRILPLVYWLIAVLSVITAIGTYERSALLGLIALAAYTWVRTRQKLFIGGIIVIAVCVIIYASSNTWNERISTIGTYQNDSSAYVRILVWKWTLEFTSTHPFGGGFVSYLMNHVEVPPNVFEPGHIEFARAFHSIYFEILGEHGYPGMLIFLSLAVSTFLKLRRVAKRARCYAETEWLVSLCDALQGGLLVFMICGAFVGIAFQPMFWYFVSVSICLSAYLRRLERQAFRL
jgi:putative inorganic carbon (hco3(-)) transporter